LIEGILVGILTYIVALSFKSVIQAAVTKSIQNSGRSIPINVNAIVSIALVAIPIGAAIAGLIGGLILGLIFAAVEGRYMKNQSIVLRGLVFGAVLFLIDLALGIRNFANYGLGYASASLVISFVGSLLFGYLLGFFFARFGPPLVPAATFQSPGTTSYAPPAPSGTAWSPNAASSSGGGSPKCPRCGAPVAQDSVYCPSCGANLKQT